MTDNIDTLLDERGKTHGDYALNARITQELKHVMQSQQNWIRLSPSQRETLDMVALKIGRILSGNPNFADHWDDIAGYSRLVSREIGNPLSVSVQQNLPRVEKNLSEALALIK